MSLGLIAAGVEFALPHIGIAEFLHLDILKDCNNIYLPLDGVGRADESGEK